MVRPEIAGPGVQAPQPTKRNTPVKVIASSVRKGNVLDIDGKLYVVMTAESFHPGKGTPITQIDMRRISDGVKMSAALQDHRAGRARPCRGSRASSSSTTTPKASIS